MSGRKNYPVFMSDLERILRDLKGQTYSKMKTDIQQSQVNFNKKIEKTARKLRQHVDGKVEDLRRDLQIERETREKTAQELRQYVDGKVEDLRRDLQIERETREKTAQEWMKVLDVLSGELHRLQAQRFRPVDAQRHEQMLEILHQNMKDGNFEATIAQAQTLYSNSFPLLADLETLCAESARLETEIEKLLEKVSQVCEKPMLHRDFSTTQGQTETVDIDLSFWAEDLWKKLLDSRKELDNRKKDAIGKAGIEEIRQLRKDAEKVLDQYVSAVEEAFRKYYLYIASMDRQEEIAEALGNQGFEVIENFFEQDDERKSNVSLFENASGEKILVRVVPELHGETIKISFSSLNPVTHASRMRAINQVIGVQPVEEPGYETRPAPAEDFNLQRYKQKRQNP